MLAAGGLRIGHCTLQAVLDGTPPPDADLGRHRGIAMDATLKTARHRAPRIACCASIRIPRGRPVRRRPTSA